MLKVRYSARFKKDFKIVKKRGYQISLLEEIISMLCYEKPLPPKNNDHPLSGNYSGFRECHINPDWLLIYKKHI
jgi:mRNA interferase YafQ